MPSLQEIKDLTQYIVSENLEPAVFALYYNFCMADLSEVIGYEKDMTPFQLSYGEAEKALQSDLFEIVSVIINKDGSDINEIAFEVGVNDEVAINDIGFVNDKRKHVYSRWINKIYIKSAYLSNSSDKINVTVKYYGSLPTLAYDNAANIDFATTFPPIVEQHYHHIISHYIAYMYYSNANMSDEAAIQNNIYLLKKQEIKDYVKKHKKNSNRSSTIQEIRKY